MIFCRSLDGCKAMPILRNVLISDTNKGDIMGYNEQWSLILVWSFILRALNCHSNLNLPSNHISSINDIPNLLKTFKCLLTGLWSITYRYICNIFNFNDMFLSITSGC